MAGEYDFSELRNYLQGQAELGAGLDEFYLDEPWALTAVASPASLRPAIPPVPPRPAFSQPIPRPAASQPASDGMTAPASRPVPPLSAAVDIPTPRVAKRTSAAYESATSLEEFYIQIKSEAIYAKEAGLVRYMGPSNPQVLFLLPSVKMGQDPAGFFQSPVGEMLVRLFANLNVTPETMGVTYFLKASERPLAPLLENALRKMLVKELSFINPRVVVSFGEPLFHQLFGKGKNFDELAGTDLEFDRFKVCSLVDPYQMVNDKQMKWLTWKIHIPRSTLFSIKQP
ncbi:MAG: hypothetical protein HUK20_06870 [Fibrobacter sp.]|nr:hypothetical protein [Fibrobacter sp.]